LIIELFIVFLIEFYKYKFPTCYEPIKVSIIKVSNKIYSFYALKIFNILKNKGIFVEVDKHKEKIGYKIL
jgi:threonyl-tRNA synthetase